MTPGFELGRDIQLDDTSHIRVFATGGVELSNFRWKAKGQLIAAEGLGAVPLNLTQKVDSPIYRIGAGLELNNSSGVELSIRYNGAFSKETKQHTASANLAIRF
ncbi:MAG: hypothetical protein Q4G25_10270 [Paracoccus sp. (in: a-proteobacteria)]|nr:hypothetical protein [Paracoccus sp. (in: a-proteobacteria)]